MNKTISTPPESWVLAENLPTKQMLAALHRVQDFMNDNPHRVIIGEYY